MKKTLPLTKYINVPDTAHILYLYNKKEIYLKNLMAYIKAGIYHHHHIMIIENASVYVEAGKLIRQLFSKEEQKLISYIDNDTFYNNHGNFISHNIVEHFGKILSPLRNDHISVRTWANVQWRNQENIEAELAAHEKVADCSIKDMGIMSVCSYSSSSISASLETRLMQSHEFLMTDEEFVLSPLYGNFVNH
ncbi:MEDS domain-containing protein [Bacillus sp. FJAT-29814]|uniref:MEDS domain-containing protein n=1 Tax=Bacillus sp. FJAT-29814 TaxID=1729688 RepID=UPI00082C2D09|nr:MEDS domain-containing protein [Bacillus sp. FJAT-29814]